MVEWKDQWVEVLSLFFVALGFVIALLLQSSYYSYLSVLLGGFISARLFYLKKSKEPILPFILIILGFLVGYLVGSFWVNRTLIFLSFGIGYGVSTYLHKNKILGIFKSELFLK